MEQERLHSECIKCLLNKFLKKLPDDAAEEYKLQFVQKLLKILSEAKLSESAPIVMNKIEKELGTTDDFSKEKQFFNELMMSKVPYISKKIESATDPLKLAVHFAMLGNYIDFGAMDSVSEKALEEKLDSAEDIVVDNTELENLKSELATANRLVYLTDNCGEVVMDKLLIEQIKKAFPKLKINVLVRGRPVLNDATMEDAEQIGLTKVVDVCGNGSRFAGTVLEDVSENALKIIDSADLIIAKGQANFETLRYCGKNIYYLFLCKCKMFSSRFGVAPHTGMLLNDLRMK